MPGSSHGPASPAPPVSAAHPPPQAPSSPAPHLASDARSSPPPLPSAPTDTPCSSYSMTDAPGTWFARFVARPPDPPPVEQHRPRPIVSSNSSSLNSAPIDPRRKWPRTDGPGSWYARFIAGAGGPAQRLSASTSRRRGDEQATEIRSADASSQSRYSKIVSAGQQPAASSKGSRSHGEVEGTADEMTSQGGSGQTSMRKQEEPAQHGPNSPTSDTRDFLDDYLDSRRDGEFGERFERPDGQTGSTVKIRALARQMLS
ncbi:hypothetical protein Rhopal_002916-T1 [Rhodotorula paludigena]|uniref:Uncharacterized protein n=1 Tax=Rhodotorula paludigena TaxID=86838 RepID=A0AAV5GKD8_9BASI|nr:hypothetical protein Rhopal_002916-T1 [Rhodotorula paludigena]